MAPRQLASVVIETRRLRLQPITDGRWLEQFASMMADPVTTRFLGNGDPMPRDLAEERYRFYVDHWRTHGFGHRALIEKERPESGSARSVCTTLDRRHPKSHSAHRTSAGSSFLRRRAAGLRPKPRWPQGGKRSTASGWNTSSPVSSPRIERQFASRKRSGCARPESPEVVMARSLPSTGSTANVCNRANGEGAQLAAAPGTGRASPVAFPF